MGQVPQVPTPPARSFEDLLPITCPSNFEDERAIEMKVVEMCEQSCPIDLAVSGRKVVIVMTVIVAGMYHPEMPGQLMNHGRKIFPEVRMPCVQANASFARVKGSQNP